jgi:hypothetical protein
MASRGSLFSQTLLDITNTKLEELAKGRAAFEEHSQKIHALARDRDEPIESLTAMAEAIRASFAVLAPDSRGVQGSTRDARLQTDLKNLDRFLVQAKYDPSVSDEALDQNIRGLLRHFEVQSRKFEYASLYANLTTEWLSVEQEFASAKTGEDMEDDEYVRVSKRAESRSAWERSVFEESVIDQSALAQMLRGLFEATPDDSRHLPNALNALRQRVADFERSLASPTRLLGELGWVISGLLASDLLSDEKRDVLRDFQNNPVVLREIADVLEMRLLRFQDWSWGREVLLEERRQMNGTYKIYMHEDLLQAILLQYIGVKWSAFWKTALTRFRQSKGVWKSSGKPMSAGDRQRRDYFLGPTRRGRSVVSRRERLYRTHYFLTHLRGDEGGETHTEEGEQEANLGIAAGPAQQAAPVAARSRQKARKSSMMVQQPTASLFGGGGGGGRLFSSAGGSGQGFNNEYDGAAGDNSDDEESESPMASKQRLLHLLSTDILIQTRLQGGLSCFRSQVEDLFPSLPHGTIECVLRYLGVSQPWLDFFKRFLQAPLKFASDPSAGPRQRKTGTPGSHVLSEMFAEVVLFCLDFQINQTIDGQILWRMQDDFWFWSPDHELCVRTWSTIEHFLKHAGLKVNRDVSGSARTLRQPGSPYGVVSADAGDVLPRGEIRWGMLRLDPGSGRFEIDQRVVDQHIDEVSRQLKEKRNSVFAWIQAWNSFAATFFTFNFGKPANCFGRPHVDNMLATHGRIQRQVFSKSCDMDDNDVEGAAAPTPAMSGSVIQYIKRTISRRFGIQDIPDGYFYLPAELGGLEVRSPFVHLLQIRDGVRGDDPGKLLDEFEEAEKDAYRRAKQRFDSDKAGVFGQQHWANPNLPPGPSNRETFFSWDEFIKYREEEPYGYTNELADIYATLLQQPEPQGIEMNQNGDMSMALGGLKGLGDCPILPAWGQMEPYWKWVVQFYGPAMIDRFGGFQIVDPGLLPMGMVSLLRSGRVKWHE